MDIFHFNIKILFSFSFHFLSRPSLSISFISFIFSQIFNFLSLIISSSDVRFSIRQILWLTHSMYFRETVPDNQICHCVLHFSSEPYWVQWRGTSASFVQITSPQELWGRFFLISLFYSWMFVPIALNFSADWLWISLLIGFEFLCVIDSWSTTFIVDDDLNVSSFEFPENFLKLVFNMIIVLKNTFITLSWGSVHSTNPNNFDFHDYHLFAIRKVRWIVNCLMLREYFYQVKSWLSHLNLGRIC